MIAVVNAISNALVETLAANGWPALRAHVNGSPGRIFLIDRHKLDQFMPPRVTFIPVKSVFTGRNTTRGPVKPALNKPYDAQSKAVIANPAFAGEEITFEVRVWGIASDNEEDPDGADWDYTQAIYHSILAACEEIMTGCYKPEGGGWEPVAHVKRVGREFVFALTIGVPVLKVPAPRTGTPGLPFAPAGVGPNVTDSMVVGTGDSSPGCEE